MDDVAYVDLGDGNYAVVDLEDWPTVSRHTWRLREDGYVQRTWLERGRVRHELLHRFVMRGRARRDELVDHAEGPRWDCRKVNLRVASHVENARNRRPAGDRAWKGVTRQGSGWKARIKVDGLSVALGTYPSPELAARAYDEAAWRLFGEFARLNFPPEAATP